MLGNSGAAIEIAFASVTKRGGVQDLHLQADILKRLGPGICPTVFKSEDSYYIMERLEPLNEPPSQDLILRMFEILRDRVWCHDPMFTPNPWFRENEIWCSHFAPWVPAGLARELYRDDYPQHHTLTHGDITIANVMKRADGSLVLIDPLQPKPYAPSLPEVDVGKLLQSAAGWESVVSGGNGEPLLCPKPWPWQQVGQAVAARCDFWAAIQCARVIKYAKTDKIRDWCDSRSREFTQKAIDATGF